MARNSKVILAKNIKLDRQYKNVLNYSEANMLALVNNVSNKLAESTFLSFIRQNDNSIPLNISYSTALQANYIAFQNPDYSNKWFFAWIDEIVYKNDSNIEIKYTIDAWSTWYSALNLAKCFIVREHVSDDTIGLHTIPEDLDVGETISDWGDTPSSLPGAESYFWLVVASNYQPAFGGASEARYAQSWIYGGYPQGSAWFAWLINWNTPTDVEDFNDWMNAVVTAGHANDIQAVFVLPYDAFNTSGDVDTNTHKVGNGKGVKFDTNYDILMTTMHSFFDYSTSPATVVSVKNNKLYCYPYNFLRVTNNSGSFNDYKIEDFGADSLGNYGFTCYGVPCLGYSGKLVPRNYQGVVRNQDESIALGKYPTLSWATDAYTNWISQNCINLGSNIIAGSATSATAFSTGKTLEGVFSISATIANAIGQINKASMLPNTAQGNANMGDVNFGFNFIRFKIAKIRPKNEYLQVLDDYFTRFRLQNK